MNTKPFGIAVRDLLIERGYVTAMGNPNWASFALELPSLHYETLRKAVTGERAPAEKVMEEVAAALGIDPTDFYEYKLAQVAKQFDPRVVGEEQALANLEAWTEMQGNSKPKGSAKQKPRSARTVRGERARSLARNAAPSF